MAKKEVKKEKFKCLVCGKFFTIDSDMYDAFLTESKNESIHPDDRKHTIKCPICENTHLQKLIPQPKPKKQPKEKKENILTSSFSLVGDVLGNFFGLFLSLWQENDRFIIKNIMNFLSFCIAIYVFIKFFNISPTFSSIIVLCYLLLKNKE